jgi:TonB-dependent receptor
MAAAVHSGHRLRRASLLAAALLLRGAHAQELDVGALRVQVTDKDWEVPLAEAAVSLVELEKRAVTGEDGGVLFGQLPFGTYSVLVSRPGFERRLVRNVAVTPGSVQRLDVPLSAVYTEMDEFVVKDIDLAAAAGDVVLIDLKMTSAAAVDAVSADTIKRAGASDAASALKLVAGATIQDGKYAVVRGLPDRYVSSQLNGIRLPSADADKRAVQLDQFPASMIESLRVHKTFMPDQQGDATGGAIDIRLKRIPEKTVLAASVGVAYNDQITGREMLSSRDGGVSYWGMDDGSLDRPFRVGEASRALSIPSASAWRRYTDEQKEERLASWRLSDAQTAAFSSDYGSRHKEARPGTRWSATAGDSVELAEDVRIGALGTFSYKNDMTGYDGGKLNNLVARSTENGFEFGRPNFDSSAAEYTVERGRESVLWGGTAAVGFESPWTDIGLTYTRSQATDYTVTRTIDDSRYDYGTGQGTIWRSQSLHYSERSTETTMLQAEHPWFFLPDEMPLLGWERLTFLPPVTDWSVSRNKARQYEPDRRLFTDIYNNGFWRGPSGGLYPLERRWRDIEEAGWQYALNQKIPFRQWTGNEGYLKAGLFRDDVTRTYEQDTFNYVQGNTGTSFAGDPDDLWSDDFLTGYPVIDAPPDLQRGWHIAPGDTDIDYRGRQEIRAWYVMGDLPLTSFLSVMGGARVEQTDISARMRPSKGEYDSNFAVLSVQTDQNGSEYVNKLRVSSDEELAGHTPALDRRDVLPALGVKLSPVENLNLRLNWSKTVARPTFKELMPVEFKESAGAATYFGNPRLKMSEIENYDARLEFMPSAGQVWSASYFHKKLTDPIDTRAYTGYVEGELFITPVNYPEGRIDGVELEVRQHLGEWIGWTKGLTIGANAALMDSEVTRPQAEYESVKAFGGRRTRRMAGQPDHLLGLSLMYEIEDWGTSLGLFFTRRGDALVSGDSVNGDRYIPMIFENTVDTLDFSLSQKFWDHWNLGFRVKNILDPDIEQEYRLEKSGEALRSSYKLGREYSLSLSCEW